MVVVVGGGGYVPCSFPNFHRVVDMLTKLPKQIETSPCCPSHRVLEMLKVYTWHLDSQPNYQMTKPLLELGSGAADTEQILAKTESGTLI